MNADAREICVLHANCQAEPLARLLRLSPAFAARWRIHIYTNYTREAIPDAALKNATLFLYQYLDPKWEELGSDALLLRMGPKTLPLCIPTMFFQGYWPFWTQNSPMEFGDYFLDRLCDAGAEKAAMLRVYLRGDVSKMADCEAVVRQTLEREFAKEERCAVKTASFVAANWKAARLFQTVNHPDVPLLLHVAQNLLTRLDMPPLPPEVCETFSYGYEGFCLPVHPGVAAFHGLPFAGEATRYPVFGREMTFAEYASRYIDCRINRMEDMFLGYLQMV